MTGKTELKRSRSFEPSRVIVFFLFLVYKTWIQFGEVVKWKFVLFMYYVLDVIIRQTPGREDEEMPIWKFGRRKIKVIRKKLTESKVYPRTKEDHT